MEKFKLLDHTADIKFIVSGKNINEIFENSALAISSYLSQTKKVSDKKTKEVVISGIDSKSLLYNFLDEIIFLLEAHNFLVSSAKILSISDKELRCTFNGDESEKYSITSIKAATYSDMYIKETKGNWEAQFVMDV